MKLYDKKKNDIENLFKISKETVCFVYTMKNDYWENSWSTIDMI